MTDPAPDTSSHARVAIRYATAADLRAFYGERAAEAPSMRAIVGVTPAGEILGVGGVRMIRSARETPVLFMDLKPEARAHRRELIKAVRMTLAMVGHAVAVCDASTPRAREFLEHFGLERIGHTLAGELYEWR